MPAFEDSLARVLAHKPKWIGIAVDMFREILSNDKKLQEAFCGRQSLQKNRERFPTESTSIEEFKAALTAINKGDTSVYSRYTLDEGRQLQIIEEPAFDLGCSIQQYIQPLSLRLAYDAACFDTVFHLLYSPTQPIAPMFDELSANYSDDQETILKEKKALEIVLKKALEIEILKFEYARITKIIIGHKDTPPEVKEKLRQGIDFKLVTPLEIRDKIISLHSAYTQIKALARTYVRINLNIQHKYLTARQALQEKIDAPYMPPLLLEKARGLLALPFDLDSKDKAKDLIKIMLQESSALDIEVRRIEGNYQETFDRLTHCTDSYLRDPLKSEGQSLLANYVAARKQATTLVLVEDLTKEIDTSVKRLRAQEDVFRLIDVLRSEYEAQKELLQAQITNDAIPVRFKSKAISLLEIEWSFADVAQARHHISRIKRECRTVSAQVTEALYQCNEMKKEAQIVLSNDFIREELKRPLRELLNAHQTKIALTDIETSAIKLHNEASGLREKECYERQKSILQPLLDDTYIPEKYKTRARTLLAGAETTSHNLKRAYEYIVQKIHDKESQCRICASKLEGLLRNSFFTEAFKVEARLMLQDYRAHADATDPKTPLATLIKKAKALDEVRHKVITTERLKRLKDRHFETVLKRIDEIKVYGESISCAQVTELAASLEKQIDDFVAGASKNPCTQQKTAPLKQQLRKTISQHNRLIQSHSNILKPIVANILLALTGIGAIVIFTRALYVGTQIARGRDELALNRFLLFTQTRKEHLANTARNAALDMVDHVIVPPLHPLL